jgi:hypothetical protein
MEKLTELVSQVIIKGTPSVLPPALAVSEFFAMLWV